MAGRPAPAPTRAAPATAAAASSTTASGLGGAHDKAAATFFRPTRFYWRSPLEILRVESWAARKAIGIPVDDMFLRWREWSDGDVDGAGEHDGRGGNPARRHRESWRTP